MPGLAQEMRRLRGPDRRGKEYWQRRKAEHEEIMAYFEGKGLLPHQRAEREAEA